MRSVFDPTNPLASRPEAGGWGDMMASDDTRADVAAFCGDAWPVLTCDAWKDTYATLHMWTQIVGKVALAHAPPLNHSWGVAFHPTSRGWSTLLLAHGERSFSIEFDFIDH